MPLLSHVVSFLASDVLTPNGQFLDCATVAFSDRFAAIKYDIIEVKIAIISLYSINWLGVVTEIDIVYCAVGDESLSRANSKSLNG